MTWKSCGDSRMKGLGNRRVLRAIKGKWCWGVVLKGFAEAAAATGALSVAAAAATGG